MAQEKDLLATISTLAALVTPFALAALGGIGWFIKKKIEASQEKQEAQLAKQDVQFARIRELEDKLREDRIATYNELLAPFFLMFTSEAAFALDKKYKGQDKNSLAMSQMLSVEYRKVGFKLSLVGTDEVVRAYNKLMQFVYHSEADNRQIGEKTSYWLALMGDLLLEIRKSMGNAASSLDRWEMLEWFISDTPSLRLEHEERNTSGS
ncbi:MAG: hypothetical protein ACN6OP_05365 [Pseudomonadales bacterium]